MNSATVARLLGLNRDFYNQFGDSFSATRHRIQPGVRRVLEMLQGDESILDLGCGNGELARVLAKRNHHGSYLGLDFSLPLLRDAESMPKDFPARFMQMDLTQLSVTSIQSSITDHWSLITAFALLHHIPSTELRLDILKKVRALLKPEGRFILSNWQFLNSEKLKGRIQPWETAAISGLALSTVEASDVEANDYLLDWRSGGRGLRYVHHFNEEELFSLATSSGFEIVETFYSDGENNKLGIYEVWK